MEQDPLAEFSVVAFRAAPGLLRLATALTRDPHAAEDLVQDALLQAFAKWNKVRQANNASAYMRKILVNRFRQGVRKKRVREVSLDSYPDRTMTDSANGAELGLPLLSLVKKLPTRQQAALALRYLEDRPDDEIAQILRCRPATVRSLIARGLLRLRQEHESPTSSPAHLES